MYQPNDLSDRPVLAWFHGGALMMGHRRDVPKQFLELRGVGHNDVDLSVASEYFAAMRRFIRDLVPTAR